MHSSLENATSRKLTSTPANRLFQSRDASTFFPPEKILSEPRRVEGCFLLFRRGGVLAGRTKIKITMSTRFPNSQLQEAKQFGTCGRFWFPDFCLPELYSRGPGIQLFGLPELHSRGPRTQIFGFQNCILERPEYNCSGPPMCCLVCSFCTKIDSCSFWVLCCKVNVLALIVVLSLLLWFSRLFCYSVFCLVLQFMSSHASLSLGIRFSDCQFSCLGFVPSICLAHSCSVNIFASLFSLVASVLCESFFITACGSVNQFPHFPALLSSHFCSVGPLLTFFVLSLLSLSLFSVTLVSHSRSLTCLL